MGALRNIINHLKAGGIARAFRHRQYAIYSVGSWSSSLSVWIQRVAIGWLTWELTGSFAWLGGITLAQSLPSFFIAPFSGALADRVNRLKLLRITEFLNGTLALIIGVLAVLNLVTIEILLTYSVARGITGNIGVPARVTISPTLVPPQDLSAAIAANSIVSTSASFVGPGVAGIIIAQAGVGWALIFSAICVAVMFGVLCVVKPLREEHRKGGGGGSLISDVVEGVRYVTHHAGIGPMLLIAAAASILLRPLTDLMPGIADDVFARPTAGLATFMTVFGIGGMIGSIWIANRNRMRGTLNIFLGGTMAATVLIIVFMATSNFPFAIVLVTLFGISSAAIMNASQILIQSSVEGAIRARVMSIYALNYRTAPSVGAMLMGGAAEFVSLQLSVSVCTVLFLLGWIWLYRQRQKFAELLEGEPRVDGVVQSASSGRSKTAE